MDWMLNDAGARNASAQPRSFQFKPLDVEGVPSAPLAGDNAAPAGAEPSSIISMQHPVSVRQPSSATEKTAADYEKMPIGDVLYQAASNVPESAYNIGKGLYTAVSNPSQTFEGVKQLGSGIYSKVSGALGGESHPENENVLNALLSEYADTYGSMGGFKKRLAEDPFFIGMDAATLIPGVGPAMRAAGVGEKAAGVIGKVASVAGKVLDPVQGALAVAKAPIKIGTAIGKAGAATASGVPKIAYDMAQAAGASTNPKARAAFAAAASGKMDSQVLADTAVKALDELKANASAEYRATHGALDTAVVDTSPIHAKITEIENQLGARTPTTVTNRITGAVTNTTVGLAHAADELEQLQKMRNAIDAVDNSTRAADRTIDGVDRAKKAMDDILSSYRGNKLGLLNEVKTVTKEAMNAVDPKYGEMLDRWSEWRRQMKDLQTQLVGSNNASDSARIAKLLKSLSSDRKMNLLKMITGTPSGEFLPEMIAGHALSKYAPANGRGLIDVLAGGGLYYAGAHPAVILGGAALASPKIGGQIANKVGMAERMAGNVMPPQITEKPLSMVGNLEEDRQGRKSGGRVSTHDIEADQLVRAAERAKKGWNDATEPLLNQSDDAVAHALEVANRSI
jgi:hypothetical protein